MKLTDEQIQKWLSLETYTVHEEELCRKAIEWAISEMQPKWISVKDRPLFEIDNGTWVATRDGDNPNGFWAAVPTNNGWWIRHCIIEDMTGLCVVGDDWNEPASYELEYVTHWLPLPEPPNESQ